MDRRYRYYITNIFDGSIQGSDEETEMMEASRCDEFFILDTATGKWLVDGELLDIHEYK